MVMGYEVGISLFVSPYRRAFFVHLSSDIVACGKKLERGRNLLQGYSPVLNPRHEIRHRNPYTFHIVVPYPKKVIAAVAQALSG